MVEEERSQFANKECTITREGCEKMTALGIWGIGCLFTIGFLDKEMKKARCLMTFATIIMWPVFLGCVCRDIVDAITKEKGGDKNDR